MYKVIYFSDVDMVTSEDFETLTEAQAFTATLDWYKIVTFTTSRTISDVT